MTKNDLLEGIKILQNKNPSWRHGQTAFNYIDNNFGSIARIVQWGKNIDCFYDDSKIDKFLDASLELINNQ